MIVAREPPKVVSPNLVKCPSCGYKSLSLTLAPCPNCQTNLLFLRQPK